MITIFGRLTGVYWSCCAAMNRHHYSVFVHNCRLVLLLRQEQNRGATELQPAEWRWTIPEVCDGRWHHYALNVEFPEVRTCAFIFFSFVLLLFLCKILLQVSNYISFPFLL